MKAYYRYSESERALLTEDELNNAIRIEAIERGVQPPITLPEELLKQEYNGFKSDPKAVCVYVVCTSSSSYADGIAYLDEAKAQAALDGIIKISSKGFTKNNKWESYQILEAAEPVVKKVWISKEDSWKRNAILNTFEVSEDIETKFKELADECLEDYRKIRQEIYDSKVRAEKKKEYLRLAGGNEEIAKAFWQKVEIGNWPV